MTFKTIGALNEIMTDNEPTSLKAEAFIIRDVPLPDMILHVINVSLLQAVATQELDPSFEP
jgi:hypothetical protein